MPHIFISYSKKDTRVLAEKLSMTINELEAFSAWMDKSLEAAESWAWQIQDEIEKADLVIVLLSPDVNRRPSAEMRRSFVLNEIDFAQQLHKPILPIMAIQTIAPVQIAGLEYIDLTQNEAQGIERLLGRIKKLKSPASLSENSPKPESNIQLPAMQLTESSSQIEQSASPPANIQAQAEIVTAQPKEETAPKTYPQKAKNQSSKKNLNLIVLGSSLLPLTVLAIVIYLWLGNGTQPQSSPITVRALTNDEVDAAIEAARNFSGEVNSDWQAVSYQFDGTAPMVLVPQGCFSFGENPDNQPYCFNKPFWIDQFEVTESGSSLPRSDIVWNAAVNYCEATEGRRLPNEFEWEYAASGINNLNYPWGNDWNPNNLAWNLPHEEGPLPVGSFANGVSWVGAYDMAGNVWEWMFFSTGKQVVRGGSYSDSSQILFTTFSSARLDSQDSNVNLGFRCVREID